jgi:hypothetical protein
MDYISLNINHFFQEEFEQIRESIKGKKVLFVFGDSWTNNRYIEDSKKHWCYLLKEKLEYDVVINTSNNYDSNYQIFDSIKSVLCNDDFPMKKKDYLNTLKEYKVIIEWSTPMRDSTSVAEMYSPYNISTIPNLNSIQANTKLWMDYVSNWFRVEIYSYDTQKRILFLQEFFKENKIDWYSFMGFTPLVEKEFEGTNYDLREWIDKDRFLFLYGFPNNMQDFILQSIEPHFSDYIGINEMQFENDRKIYFDNHPEVFTGDGHPDVGGLSIMADIVYKQII